MKIAFLVEFFPAISETFILNQITGLIDLGHEVEIFAQSNPKNKVIDEDVKKYNLMNHVHYFDMPSSWVIRSIKSFELMTRKFQRAPSAVLRSLNILKYGEMALSLRAFYMLLQFIEIDSTFDIIHCHFGLNGKMGVLLKELIQFSGKIITSFHGNDISAVVETEGKDVYTNLFKKGDLFIANSNHTKQKLVSIGCDERRIVTLPVGLNLTQFKFRPRKLTSNEKIKIISIARLVEKKGLEYSIKAVAKTIQKHPNIEYNIIGDGPLRKNLEVLINNLRAEENIHILGSQKKKDLLKK